MPIHDWARVSFGTFHNFHLQWLAALANALNADTVVTELYGYNPANAAAWRRPNEILQARFVKFGVQLDF